MGKVKGARMTREDGFVVVAPSGARFEFAPWLMWTDFRSRQNFSGNIYSSESNPMLPGGLGDREADEGGFEG